MVGSLQSKCKSALSNVAIYVLSLETLNYVELMVQKQCSFIVKTISQIQINSLGCFTCNFDGVSIKSRCIKPFSTPVSCLQFPGVCKSKRNM
jgi:hypothetical protein